MKKNWEKWVEPIIGYGAVLLAVFVIVSVLAIFGGSVMRIFGFEYESVGTVILFFTISAVISFPASAFAEALPEVLLEMEWISLGIAKLLFLLLDTFATALGMAIVDYFMTSVSATDLAIFAVAVLLALPDVKDIGSKKQDTGV